ncbi:uncharacterized protein LOC135084687 isoform X1 [Ostrinia nubilalis]|uniref:uncharacterized protein LOC135084687 isoform X1 n=1 Tax=Ostrinia nubilalis TaxID=29057 RepID=UPI0030822914
MGKQTANGTKNSKTDTKVLFKKSNITIQTHSRTCSDAFQVARSGVLQIKKKLSKTNDYYTEGDKVKRDLSVETGFCILRRYYKSKHKKDKCSVQASTAKSKCSTVADTEMDTGDEFKPDASACGDSRNKFEIVNQINPPNIDITAMMVDNLKSLLNDWIRKHVLEDAETKKKLIDVLDSILHSLGAKISSTRSSCSTYIVERNGEGYKVRNKKTATNSITCQYCKHKQTSLITHRSSSVLFRKYSRFTIPFPYKHLRIISTLSIPRNLYRKEKMKRKDMVHKVKKPPKKNVLLSENKKEKKVVINVSSCDTSPTSKKSVVRCSKTHEKTQSKRKGVVFVPQMIYKSTTEYTSTTEVEDSNKREGKKEINLDTMPSLVKSIYADDPANVTSTDKITAQHNRNDNFTMTEHTYMSRPNEKVGNSVSNVQFHEAKYECCKQNVNGPKITKRRYESHSNVNYINNSLEFPNITAPKASKHSDNITAKSKRYKINSKISRRSKFVFRKMTPWVKYENIKYKQFTYLYRKINSKHLTSENELLNHFRNVFKYFANYEGNRNIKLEIHCNVYPLFEPEEKKSKAGNEEFQDNELQMTNPTICNLDTEKVENAIEYEEKSEHSIKETDISPEIIPLLDGAASQEKYIFKNDNSTSKSEDTIKYAESVDHGTTMTGLEVSKELNELKVAIRDLSATAEMIVSEHLKRKNEEKPQKEHTNNSTHTDSKKLLDNANEIKLSNVSKGIQFSNTVAKGQLVSGIKLSKEPKRLEEFANRLKKKSSSYHVIDSESVLKVTDMTSGQMNPKVANQPKLKKSKSLLQLTTEANKQRLLAFFCDECRRNDKIIYNLSRTSRNSVSPKGSPCKLKYCKQSESENKIFIPVKLSQDSYPGCNHQYCSSAYVDIDRPTITVKKRSGLPFWEGCLYCILLWIPLVVIIYLFYDYVLKDVFKPASNAAAKGTGTGTGTGKGKSFAVDPNPIPLVQNQTTSRFLLKLSDFGF